MRLVYYAHHHGSGHLRDARRLAALGVAETTIVGPPGADVVLPADVDPGHPHREPPGSPFHWTPATDAVRDRFAAWHRVLEEVRPDVVAVDVSVEAAVFALLAGYPVISRRLPGERHDQAHRLGYGVSRLLYALYPEQLEEPGFEFRDRTRWLGMLADPVEYRAAAAPDPDLVVVLLGAGGTAPVAALARAAVTTPDRRWHVLGSAADRPGELPPNLTLEGWVADTNLWLARAGVVVCGAGANTIATVAAAHRPAIVVPEERPHAEQEVFAARLHACLGIPIGAWTGATDWPALLARPSRPDALADGLLADGATVAARWREVLEEAAQ